MTRARAVTSATAELHHALGHDLPKPHTGICPHCGSSVSRDYFTCTGCGATWTPVVGLLGYALFTIAMPCGVAAAIAVGMQTSSIGLAQGAMAVVALGLAGFATADIFRRWLWVRR